MACDLYCCRFGRFPRVALIATLKIASQYVLLNVCSNGLTPVKGERLEKRVEEAVREEYHAI